MNVEIGAVIELDDFLPFEKLTGIVIGYGQNTYSDYYIVISRNRSHYWLKSACNIIIA